MRNTTQNTLQNRYPFGSGMASFSNPQFSFAYGFNGMEKDDEVKGDGNSLDFGARIYDSRLGRWLSLDRASRESPGINNYVFVNNMPISAIDIDGDRIAIVGSTSYRVSVMATMIRLAMKSKTGREMLNTVIKSKDLLLITKNNNADQVYNYTINEDGTRKAIMVFHPKSETLSDGEGLENDKLLLNKEVKLGHELQHFIDFSNKKEFPFIYDKDNPWDIDDDGNVTGANGFSGGEVSAVEAENKIRSEMGLPLRTHYGGVKVVNKEFNEKGKLIDKKSPTNFNDLSKQNETLSWQSARELLLNYRTVKDGPYRRYGFSRKDVPDTHKDEKGNLKKNGTTEFSDKK